MNDSNSIGILVPANKVKVSGKYVTWLPGIQSAGTGAVQDQSGHGVDASLKNISDADLWANAGWFTTVYANATTAECVEIALADFTWDNKTESLIIAFRTLVSDPAAIRSFISNTNTSTIEGLRLQLNTNGTLKLQIFDGTTLLSSSNSTSDIGTGSGPVENSVILMYEKTTQLFDLYVNGEADGNFTGFDISSLDSVEPRNNLLIGGEQIFSGNPTSSLGAQIKDFHILKYAGSLPDDQTSLARKIYSNPQYPLSDQDW